MQAINIKETLEYIESIFKYFGINYITAETLRKAKFGDNS